MRAARYDVILLDETWYDTLTLLRGDGRWKLSVLHAGSREGWIPDCLYVSPETTGDSTADSHNETNSDVLENWFQDTLYENSHQLESTHRSK